jgi:transposase-like protein
MFLWGVSMRKVGEVLDALTVKVLFEIKGRAVKLLVAYGIRTDGRRELISFQRANSESTACWQAFWENLKVRGLAGGNLKLMVMDSGAGLGLPYRKSIL